jgi:hypothetical protein
MRHFKGDANVSTPAGSYPGAGAPRPWNCSLGCCRLSTSGAFSIAAASSGASTSPSQTACWRNLVNAPSDRLRRFWFLKTRVAAAVFLDREATYRQMTRTGRVLHHGHATNILVKRVEKPTDNRSASLLCWRLADANSLGTISPSLARRTSPHPPPCAWATPASTSRRCSALRRAT